MLGIDAKLVQSEIIRRVSIYLFWLLKHKNKVSFMEINKFFFGTPSIIKAKYVISKMKEDSSFLKVYIKGLDEPLYYPKEMSQQALYQVIAELLYKEDWHYYETLGTEVSPTDIVADCGAAEGLFTLLVAKRCRRAYCIEPLPRFVDALNETFVKFKNIEVMPYALGEKNQSASISSNGICSVLVSGRGGKVPVRTFDELLFKKKVTYIKADLEGSELKMLKGAFRTIKKFRPKIAITTYHYPSDARLITAFIKSIVPEYTIKYRGIESQKGMPVMLHAYVGAG